MAFVKEWDVLLPDGEEDADLIDDIIRDNKVAIDERMSVEHESFADGIKAGKHKAGQCSVAYIGNKVDFPVMNIVSAIGVALDEENSIYIGTDTGWVKCSGGVVSSALKEDKSNKNIAGGYAGLDSNSKINAGQLPALAMTNTFVEASEAAMLQLDVQVGDICIRTDISKTFILRVIPSNELSNWNEISFANDMTYDRLVNILGLATSSHIGLMSNSSMVDLGITMNNLYNVMSIFDIEHNFNNGKHVRGVCSVVFLGALADFPEVNGVGALAYDMETSKLYVRDADYWLLIPNGEVNTLSSPGYESWGAQSIVMSKAGADLQVKGIRGNEDDNIITVTSRAVQGQPDSCLFINAHPANIPHQSLSGAGVNTHAQIDNILSGISGVTRNFFVPFMGNYDSIEGVCPARILPYSSYENTIYFNFAVPYDIPSTGCYISILYSNRVLPASGYVKFDVRHKIFLTKLDTDMNSDIEQVSIESYVRTFNRYVATQDCIFVSWDFPIVEFVPIALNLAVEVCRAVPTNTPIFQSDVYVHGLNIGYVSI